MKSTTVLCNSSSLGWIRQVQKRLANHLQQKTTDLVTSSWHATVARDVYFDAARDAVAARAAPTLVWPSCLLPPGHVVTDVLPSTGTPVLLYRDHHDDDDDDDDGETSVRAYVNQCRHRGAALMNSSTPLALSTGSALICPYHAWTYNVQTGNLTAVPGEKEGFPCLDKKSLGLIQLPCQEIAGGIWVGGQEIKNYPDNDDSDQEQTSVWSKTEIDQELKDLWLPPSSSSSRLVGFREWYLEANWQIIVETFLESYHVPFLHRNTLGLVTHRHAMVVDRLDCRSVRHSVALKNFDTSTVHSNDDDDETQVSPQDPFFNHTTTTYFLFPSTAISLFKRFVVFLSIVPELSRGDGSFEPGASRRCRLRAWAVCHATAKDEHDAELQQRDFENVIRGIQEDWDCAESIQRGLTPDTVIHHGRFEGINVDFLKNVGDIAAQLAATDPKLRASM